MPRNKGHHHHHKQHRRPSENPSGAASKVDIKSKDPSVTSGGNTAASSNVLIIPPTNQHAASGSDVALTIHPSPSSPAVNLLIHSSDGNRKTPPTIDVSIVKDADGKTHTKLSITTPPPATARIFTAFGHVGSPPRTTASAAARSSVSFRTTTPPPPGATASFRSNLIADLDSPPSHDSDPLLHLGSAGGSEVAEVEGVPNPSVAAPVLSAALPIPTKPTSSTSVPGGLPITLLDLSGSPASLPPDAASINASGNATAATAATSGAFPNYGTMTAPGTSIAVTSIPPTVSTLRWVEGWRNFQYYAEQAKNPAIAVVSTLAAASFAAAAFASADHISTSDMNKEWWDNLAGAKKGLAITNGIASLGINGALNYGTIPAAFRKLFEERLPHFFDETGANIFMFGVSVGAAIAAGQIGFDSFKCFGDDLAGANAFFNFGVFWGTRFYGLVNAHDRYKKYMNPDLDPRDYTIFNIDHLTQTKVTELDNWLKTKLEKASTEESKQRFRTQGLPEDTKDYNPIDEETIKELIQKINAMIAESKVNQTEAQTSNPESTSEKFGRAADIGGASILGLAVVAAFSQNFWKAILSWSSGKAGVVPTVLKDIISIFMGSASPILYAGQAMLFRQVIRDAADNINEETNPNIHASKIGLAIFLGLGNMLACSSLYNLTESVIKNPDNIFNWILPKDPKSITAEILKGLAASGAFQVNTKLTVALALPPPGPRPVGPNQPPTLMHHARPHLKTTKLSDASISDIKLHKQSLFGTPSIVVTVPVPPPTATAPANPSSSATPPLNRGPSINL